MFRRAFISALLMLSLPSLAQVVFNGIPNSVTAPGRDGRPNGIPNSVTAPGPHGEINGIPSSVTSPTMPVIRRLHNGRPPVAFGDPHRRKKIVPVPVFYPVYQYATPDAGAVDDPQPAEDNASAAEENDALRQAYNRGAQDALARQQQQDRYGQGQRFGQSADAKPAKASVAKQAQPAPPVEDNSPPTVFVFKDGHKLETKSFAIMGQTLFDFSGNSLRKIQLADLDINATRKVNEELGNALRL